MATLPVYVKAGSIIPMQSLVQSTSQQPTDTLILHIYQGPSNTFSYYEDDGSTYRYEQGVYYQRTIRLDATAGNIVLESPTGSEPSKFHHIRLALHGFANTKMESYQTSFLAEGRPAGSPFCDVKTLVVDNSPDKIVINY